jgi:hypothetical protein
VLHGVFGRPLLPYDEVFMSVAAGKQMWQPFVMVRSGTGRGIPTRIVRQIADELRLQQGQFVCVNGYRGADGVLNAFIAVAGS